MRALVLISCILVCMGIGTAIYAESQRATVIRRIIQSSVTVIVDGEKEISLGSGTVIGTSAGYSFVLTCHHVVDTPGADIYVVPYRQAPLNAFIEVDSPEHDLALLATRVVLPVLPVATKAPELYDTVYLVGAPDGEVGSASEALITSLDYPVDKVTMYRVTDGLMMEGISGGTATNVQGELIGVPARRHAHTTQQGALVPWGDVKAFLRTSAVAMAWTRDYATRH